MEQSTMSASDLKPYELMQNMVDFLEREFVPYRIVGSMASIIYGEPRFTNDVDILVDLPLEKVTPLCNEFPAPDYYISSEAVQEAIAKSHQFNILHLPSGLKIDMILPVDTEFSHLDLSHGQRIISDGFYDAWFALPENVILKKTVVFSRRWFRQTSS